MGRGSDSLPADTAQAQLIPRLGFLCSQYPAVSHTFVLREVEALRRLGVTIDTFSIHRAAADHLLTNADSAAFQTTYAILPPRWRKLLGTHLKLALRAPRAYASTLAFALRLAAPGLRARLWQVFYFAEAVALWAECRRRGIRHIHVHLANAGADVALLATRLGSKIEDGSPWSWSFTMHGPTEFSDVARFHLADKVRFARFVVCISQFARSQLMAVSDPTSWAKLHVIHCGVPLGQFTPTAHDVRNDSSAVLCIGRLVPEKGHAILLQAAALLAERRREVKLTIAGEGPSRPTLERLARELGIERHTTFLGAVGQNEIHALYSSATIFCLPSFAEGIPGVLMEAMATMLPVVSSRITGVPELIEDGRTGLLVTPGCAEELADALERLLASPSLLRDMGRLGRERVIKEFNTAKSAEQLCSLLVHELLPNGARGSIGQASQSPWLDTPDAGAAIGKAHRPRRHDAPAALPAQACGKARAPRAQDHARPQR